MVINYATAYPELKCREFPDAIRHGLRYLRKVHRDPRSGGYAWIIRHGIPCDTTQHAYGLAFVLLAYARSAQAGIGEATGYLYETWELIEQRFWEPEQGLYTDEATAAWQLSAYRGQNSNMHLCEALMAAYEATQDLRFLHRAELLADHITRRQAALSGHQVWEHYRSDWTVDWEYNKGDRTNIFRPWGFQPGHQFEWAKLLLQLDRHSPRPWRLPRARSLFSSAAKAGWDDACGGFIYGYDPSGQRYDGDKYSWVQIEAMAAAALLSARTGDTEFARWYETIGEYGWKTFVDPATACWHRVCTPDNLPSGEAAPFSGLTDYHTIAACIDIIRCLESSGPYENPQASL